MWPLIRPKPSIARDTVGQATAVIDRAQIPELLSELVMVHTGTARSIGVLSVRIAVAGAPEFDFAPKLEDLILDTTLARVRGALRTSDRIGVLTKHELCVILPMITGVEQAELAALKLLRDLNAPVPWEGGERPLRASIGIAAAPEHGTDSFSLVRAARAAAHIADSKGESYHVFTGRTGEAQEGGHHLETALRRALSDNELSLAYQPQIDLATGAMNAAESLARWVTPDGKNVSPAHFIPLAEQRGLMGPFTNWSLNGGLRQLASFRAAGIDMSLSVNVSPINLYEPDFPEVIAASLGMRSVPPAQLTLEITESTPMHDAAKVVVMLNRLKAVGVRLAIDDFGTGYSSLSLLRQLPVDELKIDQ
ncbi:MAG: bifunctional diguanylate cyclase/phosphodiesterase, partial [Burkholderiales bacterium]